MTTNKANIIWYENEELAIFFNTMPRVAVRYVVPSMTTLEKQSVKKFPFICKSSLNVAIFDRKKEKCYKFTIHKDYCWNGSDIPRIFWRLVGAKSEPQYLIASCIHDFICQQHDVINNDRRLSSMIFRACLLEAGVNKFKANVMAESVDLFQRIVGKWEK